MIISVGNIAMGGTGKTPFTIFLAEFFSSLNKKVSILSLGYRGKLGYGTNIISTGKEILYHPPYSADEPYLMAKRLLSKNVSVITGKSRQKSYELAVELFKPDVFILDDAFQHRKMPRDIDIVLLDYTNPISSGMPFPFGYLREFPKALNNADIIIFTRAEDVIIPKKVQKYCINKPVFFCRHKYNGFFHNCLHNINYLKNKKIWLFSGIAAHKQFRKQAEAYGAIIIGENKFRDHKIYSDSEIENIIYKAKAGGADFLLTTEKDAVKIPDRYLHTICYPVVSIDMLNDGLTELLSSNI